MIPIDTRTTGPFTHLLHGGSIPREVICTSRSDLWRSASNTKHLRQEAIPALLAHQTPPRAQGLSRRGIDMTEEASRPTLKRLARSAHRETVRYVSVDQRPVGGR
jgi:hypothetical protein